jgi:hypothetical protein
VPVQLRGAVVGEVAPAAAVGGAVAAAVQPSLLV